MPLNLVHREIINADIVICSASSLTPIIGNGAVENALKNRANKPMIIIDLAVPRNVEPEIKDLIKPGTDSIDVGVYRGVYSYEMSKYSKTVHSFEPNPVKS